jgi:hypothetical protein
MIDQPPGIPVPEEEQQPPVEAPPEAPPPPPEPPPPPPAPPQQPMPSPVELQAAQAAQHFNAARVTLGQQYQALDAAERAAQSQIQPLIDQIRQGVISPEQAAPVLEQANRERQARLQKADEIQKAAAELKDLETRTSYELAEQHRRGVLEPVARQMAIQGLIDEAAQRSGDPEGFNKTRLKKQLERTPPDAWRAMQEAAVEDHREQRLTARAAAGTDEMGGTGTSGVLRNDASADENIMAGLRQHYGDRAR